MFSVLDTASSSESRTISSRVLPCWQLGPVKFPSQRQVYV